MRNWKLILTATLLASLNAAAQTADTQSTTQASAADQTQTTQPAATVTPTAQQTDTSASAPAAKIEAPATLPAWEQSNMLVKYFISTRGVEIASTDR